MSRETIGRIGPTDKKAIGFLAAIGGAVALITLWPKVKEHQHRKGMEQFLERHRAWKQRQGK